MKNMMFFILGFATGLCAWFVEGYLERRRLKRAIRDQQLCMGYSCVGIHRGADGWLVSNVQEGDVVTFPPTTGEGETDDIFVIGAPLTRWGRFMRLFRRGPLPFVGKLPR